MSDISAHHHSRSPLMNCLHGSLAHPMVLASELGVELEREIRLKACIVELRDLLAGQAYSVNACNSITPSFDLAVSIDVLLEDNE